MHTISVGNEKKVCHCGSKNCSGFLGVRPKTQNAIALKEKKKKEKQKKKRKKDKAKIIRKYYPNLRLLNESACLSVGERSCVQANMHVRVCYVYVCLSWSQSHLVVYVFTYLRTVFPTRLCQSMAVYVWLWLALAICLSFSPSTFLFLAQSFSVAVCLSRCLITSTCVFMCALHMRVCNFSHFRTVMLPYQLTSTPPYFSLAYFLTNLLFISSYILTCYCTSLLIVHCIFIHTDFLFLGYLLFLMSRIEHLFLFRDRSRR